MAGAEKPAAPGLRWEDGKPPRWRASRAAIKDGYPVRSVNLSLFADDTLRLVERCHRLQAEMLAWLSGRRGRKTEFDGTIGSLITLYQRDPESPYRTLRPASRKPYDVYARMIEMEIGALHIDDCDGRNVRRWFAAWSKPERPEGRPQIAKARMAIAVLRAALSFGIQCRHAGCLDFKQIIDDMQFATVKPRTAAPSAAQVIAARAHAHKLGHAAAALAYAIQFEGIARQWDVIGQWIPLAEPEPSDIHDRGAKWTGPRWSNIDASLVMRYTPSKTRQTTGKEVVIDFRAAPMVMEELAGVPEAGRRGPLIVNPATGLPYRQQAWGELWRAVRKAAGIPAHIWNRDLRAGATTEARRGEAHLDDLRKVMGHTEDSTTAADVYDRAHLEAHRRVAAARKAVREAKT